MKFRQCGSFSIVLQVNGKLRDKILVNLDASDTELEAAALARGRLVTDAGG